MIIHFPVGRRQQFQLGASYVEFGRPLLGEGGAAPPAPVAASATGGSGDNSRSRRDRREDRWARSRRKIIEAQASKPAPIPKATEAPRAEPAAVAVDPPTNADIAGLLAAVAERPETSAQKALARANQIAWLLLLEDA